VFLQRLHLSKLEAGGLFLDSWLRLPASYRQRLHDLQADLSSELHSWAYAPSWASTPGLSLHDSWTSPHSWTYFKLQSWTYFKLHSWTYFKLQSWTYFKLHSWTHQAALLAALLDLLQAAFLDLFQAPLRGLLQAGLLLHFEVVPAFNNGNTNRFSYRRLSSVFCSKRS
jgi:hypothetical protein